jgi:hypothetical protein
MADLNIPNLDKLIAHLEAQPPEKFNMRNFYTRNGETIAATESVGTLHECGTAACIAGHIYELNHLAMGMWTAGEWLGLSLKKLEQLFCPDGYRKLDVRTRYPLWRAIATLKRLRDRFLATGEIVVDWGPEPTEGQPWAAPQAVELTPPALPETITRFLAAERQTAGEV